MTQQIKEGRGQAQAARSCFDEGENVRVVERPLRELLRIRRRGDGREGKAAGHGPGLRPRDAGRPGLHERREGLTAGFSRRPGAANDGGEGVPRGARSDPREET